MTSCASFSVAALPVLAVYLTESWLNNREYGAYLVTAYGVGNFFGATILMVKPLRKEALQLLRNVGAILLVTLMFIAVSHSFYTGLFSYWLVGVINAIFFAVTLAARSEYSPEKGAAQIYMWVAAAKIGAASLGALMAGFLVDKSILVALIFAICILALSLLFSFTRVNKLTAKSH